MVKRWLGLIASGESVTAVDATIPINANDPITINSDDTWRIQKGDRSAAYFILHQQCADYVKENGIDEVIIKASAVSGRGGATVAYLLSAEVRGVVISAAASQCSVRSLAKAAISKTYGKRKVDEYVADDDFWSKNTVGGKLRKMSREAAMLLIAARTA